MDLQKAEEAGWVEEVKGMFGGRLYDYRSALPSSVDGTKKAEEEVARDLKRCLAKRMQLQNQLAELAKERAARERAKSEANRGGMGAAGDGDLDEYMRTVRKN